MFYVVNIAGWLGREVMMECCNGVVLCCFSLSRVFLTRNVGCCITPGQSVIMCRGFVYCFIHLYSNCDLHW